MLDVGPLRVTRNVLGTAEGNCTLCGAYLSVTIPSDGSALDALTEAFEEHMARNHSPQPQPSIGSGRRLFLFRREHPGNGKPR